MALLESSNGLSDLSNKDQSVIIQSNNPCQTLSGDISDVVADVHLGSTPIRKENVYIKLLLFNNLIYKNYGYNAIIFFKLKIFWI